MNTRLRPWIRPLLALSASALMLAAPARALEHSGSLSASCVGLSDCSLTETLTGSLVLEVLGGPAGTPVMRQLHLSLGLSPVFELSDLDRTDIDFSGNLILGISRIDGTPQRPVYTAQVLLSAVGGPAVGDSAGEHLALIEHGPADAPLLLEQGGPGTELMLAFPDGLLVGERFQIDYLLDLSNATPGLDLEATWTLRSDFDRVPVIPSPVPEPATTLLMSLGLLMLGAMARRRVRPPAAQARPGQGPH